MGEARESGGRRARDGDGDALISREPHESANQRGREDFVICFIITACDRHSRCVAARDSSAITLLCHSLSVTVHCLSYQPGATSTEITDRIVRSLDSAKPASRVSFT